MNLIGIELKLNSLVIPDLHVKITCDYSGYEHVLSL